MPNLSSAKEFCNDKVNGEIGCLSRLSAELTRSRGRLGDMIQIKRLIEFIDMLRVAGAWAARRGVCCEKVTPAQAPTPTAADGKASVRAAQPGARCRVRACGPWGHPVAIALSAIVLGLSMGGASADVYKYVDKGGNIYFSDEPLPGVHLSLEWKRTSKRLVSENKQQSEEVQRAQAAVQARIDARLEASINARTDLYALRPSKPVSGSMSVRRARYRHLIDDAARRHGLTPELLHAVIRTESAYQVNARSHAGACGLMQLMPQTAARFKVVDIWDPAQNIQGGAAYLRFLLDLFDHDLRLALAGYNAGEGAVKKYGYEIPPYRETQNYVRKVLRHLSAEGGMPRRS